MTKTINNINPIKSVVILLFLFLVVSFCLVITADDKPKPPDTTTTLSTPIKVTGEDFQTIKDAYLNVQFANQQFELAITKVKYNMSIPKGFEFNIATFSFEPPKPKEELLPKKDN